ncbi:hypothetical protein AGMMS49949_00670 [Alphaproteobacteria bacterium]|nr:hypothetical protein AGMMS49949_00670 [Alphaproteobacteria bacterium]GHS98264.1 hypothetical protein AGMMS50296_5840 [Alphaproteobacteria bacterium]
MVSKKVLLASVASFGLLVIGPIASGSGSEDWSRKNVAADIGTGIIKDDE